MMILSSGLVLSFIQPGTIITDGGIFSSIAYKDLNGGTLYVDAWENKPPGIFYLIELFMLVIHEPVYAVFILSVLALVGLSLLVYTFIFNSTNSLSASLSLGTIGSAIILFKPNCGDGLYTEIYGTLSLVGAMILIQKLNITGKTKYLNYSLILIGLSIWFKEPFVLISIPIILYIFSKGHFKNKIMRSLIFLILPSAFFILLLVLSGSLSSFIDTVLYNFQYAGAKTNSVSVTVKLTELYNNVYKDVSPLLLVAVFFTIKAFQGKTEKSRIVWMLTIWLSSLLFALVSPYNLGHYYIPFNTFTVLYIAEAYNWNYTPHINYKWPLILLSLYSIYRFDDHYNVKITHNIHAYQPDNIVKRLLKEKDKTVFVDYVNRADMYIKTKKVPVTFVPVALPIHFQADSSGLEHRKRIYAEIEYNKPDYVITTYTTAYFSWFMPNSPYYENNYHKIDSVKPNDEEILILWKRNTSQELNSEKNNLAQ